MDLYVNMCVHIATYSAPILFVPAAHSTVTLRLTNPVCACCALDSHSKTPSRRCWPGDFLSRNQLIFRMSPLQPTSLGFHGLML